MANPEFKRAVRGYDSAEVDEFVAQLQSKISELEGDQSENVRAIQKLNRELSDTSERLAKVKPSFAELGSAFEETLRLAEQQAAAMIQDAGNESAATLSQARGEASRVRESADREARQLVDEARAKSEELRLQVEREVAQERQRIADERAKAETVRTRAERAAANMISQAEKQIAEARAENNRIIEELKREANELLRIASENKVATDAQIRDELDEAERSRSAIHDEADRYAAQAYEQADAHVESAVQRASNIMKESEAHFEEAQVRAQETRDEARQYAEGLIQTSMNQAREVSRDTDDFVANFLLDAEARLEEGRRQQIALTDYVHKLRLVSNDINLGPLNTAIAPSVDDIRSIQVAEIVDED